MDGRVKAKFTVRSPEDLERLCQRSGRIFPGHQKMLIWGLLDKVVTSCYHSDCRECFHADRCNVSKVPEVSAEEFLRIVEEGERP